MVIRNPRLVFNGEGTGGGGGTAVIDPAAVVTPPVVTPPVPTPPATGAETATTTKVIVDGKEVEVNVAQLLADNDRFQKEAESARVAAKAKVANDAKKAQLLSVAELAGIKIEKPEDETVESLTQKLGSSIANATHDDESVTASKREAAVIAAAWFAGAPADKADYLKFKASTDAELAKLDPSAANYQTSVNERIKAIVDGDPIFKATPGGAGRSGAEGFSGAGGPEVVTQEAFDKMNVQEQTNLFQKNPDLFRRLAGLDE